jgi:hypothetical protein
VQKCNKEKSIPKNVRLNTIKLQIHKDFTLMQDATGCRNNRIAVG